MSSGARDDDFGTPTRRYARGRILTEFGSLMLAGPRGRVLARGRILAGFGSLMLAAIVVAAALPPTTRAAPNAIGYRLADVWSDVPRSPAAGDFRSPLDITSLPDGTTAVLDRVPAGPPSAPEDMLALAIHRLPPPSASGDPGSLEDLSSLFSTATRLDAAADGTLLVLGGELAGPQVVVRLTAGATATDRYAVGGGTGLDVASSPSGRVYVTMRGAGGPDRIDGFEADGTPLIPIIPDEMDLDAPGPAFRYLLSRLDVGLDGTLYVMAVGLRDCPGTPNPGPPPPRPTPTPRPSFASPDQEPPCRKDVVLVFNADHTFREEIPQPGVDIAAGVSGVFVSVEGQAFRRPAQRVYALGAEDWTFTYPVPRYRDAPIPYSAPEMQMDVAPDGRVQASTSAGAPWYRGAIDFGDPRDASTGRPRALGIYERPLLDGPRHVTEIDAADRVVLLERPYQRVGTDRHPTTSVDVPHDAAAVQVWSKAGVPLTQVTQHDALLRDGSEGSSDYVIVEPMVDVAYDGGAVYGLSRHVVWGRPDALPPQWYRHTPGAWFSAIAADAGRLAVLNAPQRRVLLLDTDGNQLRNVPVAVDATGRLLSDVTLAGDRLYLSDFGRSTILARGTDGTDLGEWPTLDGPTRITTGPGGDVFVLGRGGTVMRYAPDGTLVAAWRTPADHAGVPTEVQDIAVDDDGRVYVSFLGLQDPAAQDIPEDRPAGLDIDASGVWIFEPFDRPPDQTPTLDPHACATQLDKTAKPPVLLLGETVDVNLRVDGACPPRQEAEQLMIVLDTSFSMHDTFYPGYGRPGALHRAQDVLAAFLESLDPDAVEAGLVTFNFGAGIEVPLPGPLGAVYGRILTVRADGDTQMGAGVRLAHQHLLGPAGKPGERQTILIVSDGLFKDEPKEAIDEARADGIRVIALVLSMPGFDANARTALEGVMGGAENVIVDPVPEDLSPVLGVAGGLVPNPGLFESITIDDVVPDNMAYLADSAVPPALYDPATRTLRWTLGPVSAAEGIRLSYRLRPSELGPWPTNVEAVGHYRDASGADGDLTFPVPHVLVLAPAPIPTPTRVPTPERPRHYEIFLPAAEKPMVCKAPQHASVVLVLDTSTSMLRRTGSHPTKLKAAIAAASNFVSLLDLAPGGDQVAVVGFNDTAWTELGLSEDRRAALAALDRLPGRVAEGTRLDLALDEAARNLKSPALNPRNPPAVVLLTDGLPNRVPTPDPIGRQEDTVLVSAVRVKDLGATVFTVGLGLPGDIDVPLLTEVATAPDMFYVAPSSDDLAAIYARILQRIVCPEA